MYYIIKMPPIKICKSNEILNPKTNRCIKLNGAMYKKLLKDGILKKNNAQIKEEAQPKICPEGKIFNPHTKRCIKINTPLYKKLVKNGVLNPKTNNVQIKENIQQKNKKKICPEGKVLNPKSNRCIEIKGVLYKKLLKEGVNFHDKDVNVPVNVIQNLTCKNNETFFLMTDIKDIPREDLFRTENGYCFSINELISWLDSDTFNNKNPHDNSQDLFYEDKISQLVKHPQLKSKVERYFKSKKSERDIIIDILHKHMDILYNIGRVGRICYYNNITSFSTDSSPFEYSIEALISLTEMIEKLNARDKEIINNLVDVVSFNLTLHSLITAANNGNSCIHGVGRSLILMFVYYFLSVEKKYKTVYEPLKTGLYFVKHSNKYLIKSMDNYFVPDPLSHYYRTNFGNTIEPLLGKHKKSSIYLTNLNNQGKTSLFNRICQNDSNVSGDEWKDVSEWKKFMTTNKYCYDIFSLIKIITDQLNTVKNSNPFPTYPKDIYTNNLFTEKDLLNIKRIINDNTIIVSPPLKIFLNSNNLWRKTLNENEYLEWRDLCINEFDKTLRYCRLNKLKTQGIIDGAWTTKTTPVSNIENLIYIYLNTVDESIYKQLKSYNDQIINDAYYIIFDENKPHARDFIKAYN